MVSRALLLEQHQLVGNIFAELLLQCFPCVSKREKLRCSVSAGARSSVAVARPAG